MNIKKFTIFIVVFFTCSFYAQVNPRHFVHPFSGKVVFTGEFGFTHSYTDYLYPVPKLVSKGSIEFYLPVKSSNALGLKVFSGLGNLNAYGRNDEAMFKHPNFNTNTFMLGTGVTFALKYGYSIPYFSATLSHFRINPKDNKGKLLHNNFLRKYNQNLMLYSFEFGFRFLMQNFWSFNLGMNWNLVNSDYVDDLKANNQNDKYVSLFCGISFYYGGSDYTDTDGDGVPDCKDVCPATPQGAVVDEFGCEIKKASNPKEVVLKFHKTKKKKDEKSASKQKTDFKKIDSDKDGVPDYLDKCPDTPQGTKVTANGCKEKKVTKVKTKKTDSSVNKKIHTVKHKNKTQPAIKKSKRYKKIKYSYKFSEEKKLQGFLFTDGTLFCFQTAEFSSMQEAKQLAKKLNKAGHHSFVMRSKNKKTFKVRVGFFKSLKSAIKYKKKFNL